ncbi:MAG TPA: hypothetical protein VJ715_18665 [Pyrinomonadaceae bacterium]|nr:hypothetical protein [Pyrinomonadaceae bacterium]
MRKLLLFTLVCMALVSGFDTALAQRRTSARRRGAAVASPQTKVLRMAVDARDSQLLGSFDGRAWADAVKTMPLVKEGETFRLYTLTGPAGTGTIGKPVPPEYPCDDMVEVAVSPLPEGEGDVFAVNGDWDAQPRPPKVQDTNQEEYRNVVAGHLRSKGIAKPNVVILQLLRVDLDGDGTEEVLISANSTATPGHFMSRGDFSVVLLRRVAQGRAVTVPIVSEVELKNHKDPVQTGNWHHKETVAAILDLNGDGVMEVITTFQSIFDGGKNVYEVKGPKPRPALGWYCSGGH